MEPIIEMKNIVKTFGDNVVLNHVNFTLYKGETRALFGVNGAGKSTLIKILNGIYRADEGEIGKNQCTSGCRKTWNLFCSSGIECMS